MKATRYPWTMAQVQQGHVIHIPTVSELPDDAHFERRSLDDRRVKSFLGIPLHSDYPRTKGWVRR